jgi:hypothetical protein
MTNDPAAYAALVTSLANWIDRDDLSTTEIPEAIALFERKAQRLIFTPDRETTADLSTTAEEITLPTDLWQIKSAYLTTDPKTFLEQMTLGELRNSYSASATGTPQNYALRGTKMILGPAPDSTYTLKLAYVQTIPALSASATTNWLLTAHPDLYIMGALAELNKLMRDDQGAVMFAIERDARIQEVNQSGVRRSYGQSPRRIRSPVIV